MKKIIYVLLSAVMISTLAACKKDKNDGGLRRFSISGTASSSFLNDADNRAANTFIDFTNQLTYNYATALKNQSTTDVVIRTSFYNGQPPTGSADLFMSSINMNNQGAVAWGGNGNLDDFGVKNTTTLAVVGTDKIIFDNITDDITLNNAFAGLSSNTFSNFIQDINSAAAVVAFKLQSGRKGLFRITNYNANKPFSYTIEVKMEK